MATYTVEKTFLSHTELTPKVIEVATMFGLGANRSRPIQVIAPCDIEIGQGEIVYIAGSSGAGKSLMLNLLGQQIPEAIDLDDQPIPNGRAVVDCFDDDLSDTLVCLSWTGLNDAFALVRCPEELSDGQRYRFRLALALAKRPNAICIYEFCNSLDRVSAAVVACNVRKFADRFGTTFVVASSHDDLLEDLAPNVVVVKHLGGACDVYYPGRLKTK